MSRSVVAVESSQGAGVFVVGTRGHGDLGSVLLGSMGLAGDR